MGINEAFGIDEYREHGGSSDAGTTVSFDPFGALSDYVAARASSASEDEDGAGLTLNAGFGVSAIPVGLNAA